jgi:GNAT superfamily N-acetyltransferase
MRATLSFRWAQESDFAAIVDLASQLAEHIEAKAPSLSASRFGAHYVNPRSGMHLLLALHDGRPMGMISWVLTHELYSADTRVYISDLSVDRSARGQGIGAALMDQAKAWAAEHNASKLCWEVWHRNAEAKAFYAKMGASIDKEAIPYVLTL